VFKPGKHVQRLFQIATVDIGPPGGQVPVGLGGFFDGGQGVLLSAQVGEAGRQVVQRPGQAGGESVGAGGGQVPADGDGFFDGGQGVLAPAQGGQLDRQVVQRPGQVGVKASGRAAARSRQMVTASSTAARASSRRPRAASWTDRLFSDLARSG
jgi:hypothetical protein